MYTWRPTNPHPERVSYTSPRHICVCLDSACISVRSRFRFWVCLVYRNKENRFLVRVFILHRNILWAACVGVGTGSLHNATQTTWKCSHTLWSIGLASFQIFYMSAKWMSYVYVVDIFWRNGLFVYFVYIVHLSLSPSFSLSPLCSHSFSFLELLFVSLVITIWPKHKNGRLKTTNWDEKHLRSSARPLYSYFYTGIFNLPLYRPVL